MAYTCSLSGECQRSSWSGEYATLEDCQANCQGTSAKDLIYKIYSFNPREALSLTDEDQARILSEAFGIRLEKGKEHFAPNLIEALVNEDYILPYREEGYIPPQADLIDKVMLEVFKDEELPLNWPALRDRFLKAMYSGYEYILDELHGGVNVDDRIMASLLIHQLDNSFKLLNGELTWPVNPNRLSPSLRSKYNTLERRIITLLPTIKQLFGDPLLPLEERVQGHNPFLF